MQSVSLTRAQSREIDRLAIESLGLPGVVLMENAGRGVVEELIAADPAVVGNRPPPVTILCGKGNNGGDGFVIARHLAIRGGAPRVALLAPAEEIAGDALTNLQVLRGCGVPIEKLSGEADMAAALSDRYVDSAWLIDALLGTGVQGEPREPLAAAIRWMNEQPAKRLAVDLPSGLDCDTGEPAAATVRADMTCTFVAPKAGFANPAAAAQLGAVRVVSIGTPDAITRQVIGGSGIINNGGS
ncbi:MAG: NAD(P)H-hydrate epimerase [Planctomycetota bacterium]